MGCSSAELSLLLTDDAEIRKLNRKYRRKNAATDVLSFPLQSGQSGSRALSNNQLGDIVISLTTAEQQAAARGLSLESEVERLLIHGLLHLMEYEHENVSSAKAKRMFSKERELCKLIGVDAPAHIL